MVTLDQICYDGNACGSGRRRRNLTQATVAAPSGEPSWGRSFLIGSLDVVCRDFFSETKTGKELSKQLDKSVIKEIRSARRSRRAVIEEGTESQVSGAGCFRRARDIPAVDACGQRVGDADDR